MVFMHVKIATCTLLDLFWKKGGKISKQDYIKCTHGKVMNTGQKKLNKQNAHIFFFWYQWLMCI